ncbi:MAG TPA: 2-C-methyl-D-erythritol 2,4-cyclodiphosphate synthase [Terriglobia bacterium]|nr:2-C-methyl-D-erythritol 2,4-cyclodiphosphate synthase [Terriglobia bacterium]
MRTLEKPKCSHRIGLGNDLHRLAAGKGLILGGVRIPFKKSAVGHSDGDALIHALCDALLGAASLGDIGGHFPDSARKWRGASSLNFLVQVRRLLERSGFRIINLDATIGLEQPKLAPHIPRIKRTLANTLGIRVGQVSVKAKTGEGIGAVGKGKAVRADAIALIERV